MGEGKVRSEEGREEGELKKKPVILSWACIHIYEDDALRCKMSNAGRLYMDCELGRQGVCTGITLPSAQALSHITSSTALCIPRTSYLTLLLLSMLLAHGLSARAGQ